MTIGLRIDIDEKDTIIILRLEGRLDATSSPKLETTISPFLQKNGVKVLVDFTQVDYLSSAGMRLLLSATKKASQHHVKIAFVGMQEEVMEIIKMAGFERILTIYGNESEALSRL